MDAPNALVATWQTSEPTLPTLNLSWINEVPNGYRYCGSVTVDRARQ